MKRIVLLVLGVLLTVVLGAAGTAYWLLSGDGVRRALEQQSGVWLGQPVHIRVASATLLPRPAVTLRDVTVGEPVAMTLATVRVSAGLRALMNRRIEAAEVVVSNSRIRMPLPFVRTAAPSTRTAAGDPVRIVSVRSISLDDVRVVSRGREILVNANSALDGSRLVLRRFEAGTGATRFEAEGVEGG